MRPLAVLLVATVLAAGGCGSDPGGAGSTGTPPGHGDTTAQAAALTRDLRTALHTFVRAGSGGYDSQVTTDQVSRPIASETGTFDLDPTAAEFTRYILGSYEAGQEPRVQVARVHATPSGHLFLQLQDWGTWTGCWLPTSATTLLEQAGFDLSQDAGLPSAVSILRHARVTHDEGMVGPHLAVDGYRALQFLGVSAAAVANQRAALARVAVPVLLDLTPDGDPSAAAVEGTLAATAVSSAGVELPEKVQSYLGVAHAQVTLHDLGTRVTVATPRTAELLPEHPSRQETCPANR